MPVIDNIKSVGTRLFTKRSGTIPLSSSGGIGNGMAAFDDEMPISKPAIVFHAMQIFFAFIAMCCFASLASFQAKWKIGPSGLSVLNIIVALFIMFLAATMVLIPVLYDKYNKFSSLARAMSEVRVHFILAGAGLVTSFLFMFIDLISAFTQAGCKNPDKDPHADLGDDFKNQLSGFCTTKKAGAFFVLFTFGAWAATFGLAILDWRSGKIDRGLKPRDPPFRHPTTTDHSMDEGPYTPGGASSDDYTSHQRLRPDDEEDDDEPRSPFDDHNATHYGSGPAPTLPPVDVGPRQSMDTYGAFSDPAPTGFGNPLAEGTSRTMHYADPYAAIRANIGTPKPPPSPSNPPIYPYRE